jgi:FtsH-binding integral membrane protein
VGQGLGLMKRLFVPYYEIRTELLECFRIPKIGAVFSTLHLGASENAPLYFSLYVVMGVALVLCLCFKNNYEREYKKNALSLVFTWAVLVVSVLSLSRISTFLYFNF